MEDLLHLPHPSTLLPLPAPRRTALLLHTPRALAATVSAPKPIKELTFTEPQLPHSPFSEKPLLLRSLGLDPLAAHPSLVATTASDIRSVTRLLCSVGLPLPDLRRACSICPEILAAGPRAISPVLTFLLREAGVPPADLRRVIHQRPRLLVSDINTRLRPTLRFLRSLGIEDGVKLAPLLSCRVEEKLLPIMEFLKGVGLAPRDVRSMARRFPDIFRYGVGSNLEPKFDFLVMEMGRDLKELREFPEYFSFSLERRIAPRHRLCKENGVVLRLSAMLRPKEASFRARLEACVGSSPPVKGSPLWRKGRVNGRRGGD